jgi:hypothetical protein
MNSMEEPSVFTAQGNRNECCDLKNEIIHLHSEVKRHCHNFTATHHILDEIKMELMFLRREIGLQCMTCTNTHDLKEDDDDFGKLYCTTCWYYWNNKEAIRMKEREIDEMQTKINQLWVSDGPHTAYRVEELLQYICECRDEIAIFRQS